MSSSLVFSVQWWLMPLMDARTSWPSAACVRAICASWPAPDGMRVYLPRRAAFRGAVEGCLQVLVIRAGRAGAEPSTASLQRPTPFARCTSVWISASSRSSTAGSASRSWNSASALPGMMLSRRGRARSVRGPHRARSANGGNRASIAPRSRTSSRPASRRRPWTSFRRDLLAFHREPVLPMATMAVTTPI